MNRLYDSGMYKGYVLSPRTYFKFCTTSTNRPDFEQLIALVINIDGRQMRQYHPQKIHLN